MKLYINCDRPLLTPPKLVCLHLRHNYLSFLSANLIIQLFRYICYVWFRRLKVVGCHAFLWNEEYVVCHLSHLAHNFILLAESSLDANPQVKFAWWVLGVFLFVFFSPPQVIA